MKDKYEFTGAKIAFVINPHSAQIDVEDNDWAFVSGSGETEFSNENTGEILYGVLLSLSIGKWDNAIKLINGIKKLEAFKPNN